MARISGLVTVTELAAIENAGYAIKYHNEWNGSELLWIDVYVNTTVIDLLSPTLCPYCTASTVHEHSKERDATIDTCPNCKAKVTMRENV